MGSHRIQGQVGVGTRVLEACQGGLERDELFPLKVKLFRLLIIPDVSVDLQIKQLLPIPNLLDDRFSDLLRNYELLDCFVNWIFIGAFIIGFIFGVVQTPLTDGAAVVSERHQDFGVSGVLQNFIDRRSFLPRLLCEFENFAHVPVDTAIVLFHLPVIFADDWALPHISPRLRIRHCEREACRLPLRQSRGIGARRRVFVGSSYLREVGEAVQVVFKGSLSKQILRYERLNLP